MPENELDPGRTSRFAVDRSPARLRRNAARSVLIMWTAMAQRTRIGAVVGTIKEAVAVFSA